MNQPVNSPPQCSQGQSARRWLAALGCILLSAVASYALFHYVLLTRLPHAMLGKWLVVGGDMDGAILEFNRDGTMLGIVNMKGKEGKINATVEVEDKTVRLTSINPITGKPDTDVQTIRSLTANQFVLEDHKGKMLRMERLRE